MRDHFGEDYLLLSEAMQEKLDEALEIIDELRRENKYLNSQLTQESGRRNEVFLKLQDLENEVSDKKRDPDSRRKKAASSCQDGLKRLLLTEKSEIIAEKSKAERVRGSVRDDTIGTEYSESDEIYRRLKLNLFKNEGNTDIDFMHYLQCEAAALEDLLEAM